MPATAHEEDIAEGEQRMRTVIFDLDGTLADTSGDLIDAANECFRSLGHNVALDPLVDRATAFKGGRAMLRLGFERLGETRDDASLLSEYETFLEIYGRNLAGTSELYPGAEQALRELADKGYRLGICTNKPVSLADNLMRSLGVRELFDSLVGADTLPVRKPDPAPYVESVRRAGGAIGRSLLIGDTVTDRDTALAARVPFVLVDFGSDDGAYLESDATLPGYDALAETVSRLIG